MLRTPTARVLDEADEPAVHRLLATDPVAACVLAILRYAARKVTAPTSDDGASQ